MVGSDPNSLGILDGLDVQVDDDRFLTAPNKDSRQFLIRTRVDLLMRHIWWHVDEVTCLRLR